MTIAETISFSSPSCLIEYRGLTLLPPRSRDSSCPLCFCRRKNLNRGNVTNIGLTVLGLERSLTKAFHLALGELGIEVRDVRVGLYQRDEWSFELFVSQSSPVHAVEPRVVLDLGSPVLCAHPRLGFLLEKSFEEISQFWTHISWNVGVDELDFIEKLDSTFRVEGRKADDHLVDK